MRLQLFEIEDQPWCPAFVRGAITDYLRATALMSDRPFLHFAVKLREAMDATGDRRILDLCSGGGGPIEQILPLLNGGDERFDALLTDLFPDFERLGLVAQMSGGSMTVSPEPVDATAVPAELPGFRLLSNAFHHFDPETGRAVLADAAKQGRGIAIFEGLNRGPLTVLLSALAGIPAALTLPWVRPIRWQSWLMAYPLPILPSIIGWDAFVSALRTYTPDELLAMCEGLGGDDYRWEAGYLPVVGLPLEITYLIGRPA